MPIVHIFMFGPKTSCVWFEIVYEYHKNPITFEIIVSSEYPLFAKNGKYVSGPENNNTSPPIEQKIKSFLIARKGE